MTINVLKKTTSQQWMTRQQLFILLHQKRHVSLSTECSSNLQTLKEYGNNLR